ncbi:MAG: flagellar protein FlaG [Planctomycetota bacterium]
MNPLASVNATGLKPDLAATSLQQLTASKAPAPGKQRPVELRPNVLDPSEGSGLVDLFGNKQKAAPKRNPAAEVEPRREAAKPVGPARKSLTYTLVDSLPPSVQVRVIDQSTDKVIRAVPSDKQIAVRESLDAFVGRNLDVHA